jgi:hypothetical protein
MSCGSGPEHDEISAQVMMEQFVSEKLKSPASAEFESGFSSKILKVGNKSYEVNSYVDSQNGFGAMIRTEFYCKVTYVGNEKWQLDELRFQ